MLNWIVNSLFELNAELNVEWNVELNVELNVALNVELNIELNIYSILSEIPELFKIHNCESL